MKVFCLKCKKEFVPSKLNTKIIGPYIEVKCPFCPDVYEGKLLSYVTEMIGGWRPQSAHDAIKMQKVAQYIELNSSDYYRKRGLRHGKKKVRDI